MTKIHLRQDLGSSPKQGATAQACATPARLATFTILFGLLLTSAGYGLLLPILSALLVNLHPIGGENISLHMGLVTAAYAAGALVSAPAWGRLADRSRHTRFIAFSLLAGGTTLVLTITASSLTQLYLWRFLAGAAAGAVSPAVQSWFSTWSEDAEWRSNYTVWSAIASNSGFLIGPLMGGLLAAAPPALFGNVIAVTEVPLALNGTLLVLAALATASIAPAPLLVPARSAWRARTPIFRKIAPLLVNVLFAAIAVGAFEVGLSIRAVNQAYVPVETGLLLAECTIFMSAAQALLLLRSIRNLPFAPLLAVSWMSLFLGLVGTGLTTTYLGHAVSTALFGLGGGLLPPLAARLIADRSQGQIGFAAGMQTTASHGGQFVGGVGAGLIAAWLLPKWTFLAASVPAILLFAAAIFFSYGELGAEGRTGPKQNIHHAKRRRSQ